MLVRKIVGCCCLIAASTAWSQQISKLDRGRAEDMLHTVGDEVRKHYYDPKFHGLDWDGKLADTRRQIDESKSFNMAISHIAAMLDTLNDSHTFFLPPQHAYHHDFGWQYQIIGERCFVTQVRPGSDGEAKGLKRGDEILAINGFTPDRNSLWRMKYVFSVLRPQPSLQLNLQDPAGNRKQLEVVAKVRELKRVNDLTGAGGASDIWELVRQGEADEHLNRARWAEYGDDLLILRFPEFSFSPSEVGEMINKARKYKALIIDLRGNPGGSVETLKSLVSGMFDKEVKIGDRVGRKENKPMIAKASHNPFTGKLAVLVDSQSASAAELFARVIQLEKRGAVLGDHTSGSVMEARHYDEQNGSDTVVFYGVSVTDADVIMSDGKSLEHVGVTPDELLIPSVAALANNRDPVLAHAAESVGVKITSEEAGKIFPYEWPPEQ
jgi:C-terminal processing protease CtpA/Prc